MATTMLQIQLILQRSAEPVYARELNQAINDANKEVIHGGRQRKRPGN